MEHRDNTVKSVLKAFLILEEINKKSEISIGEISENLKMDKGTVHRLVTTIKEAGYVTQNPENKKYVSSLKLFAMGNKVAEKTGIKKVARPCVEKLAAETKETVNLGIRVGGEIIYIDKIESRSTIKVGIDIGTSIPDYCTGMGKAVLAFIPKNERDEILKDVIYKAYTQNTARNRSVLEEKLCKIREKGYSTDDEEFVEGLISFGAPIFDFHGKPVAAISVSCPKYRYDEKGEDSRLPEVVMEAAGRISGLLGYIPR